MSEARQFIIEIEDELNAARGLAEALMLMTAGLGREDADAFGTVLRELLEHLKHIEERRTERLQQLRAANEN
jgi:hypothetical protein